MDENDISEPVLLGVAALVERIVPPCARARAQAAAIEGIPVMRGPSGISPELRHLIARDADRVRAAMNRLPETPSSASPAEKRPPRSPFRESSFWSGGPRRAVGKMAALGIRRR